MPQVYLSLEPQETPVPLDGPVPPVRMLLIKDSKDPRVLLELQGPLVVPQDRQDHPVYVE